MALAVVVAVMLAAMVVAMVVPMVVVVDGWGYNDVWGDVVLDADSMVELILYKSSIRRMVSGVSVGEEEDNFVTSTMMVEVVLLAAENATQGCLSATFQMRLPLVEVHPLSQQRHHQRQQQQQVQPTVL